MGAFRHVLVATDFSAASRRAVELAVRIARDGGADLTVVNVCELPIVTESMAPVDLVTPLADAAQDRLAGLIRSVHDVCPAARSVLRVGDPAEQILAETAELGADLVVAGTHGRRGFAHALLGSVAERLVRLSPVPVLTVRTRE